MQKRLQRYDIVRWARDFMERLAYVKKSQRELLARHLTKETRKILVSEYAQSRHRLILLDYDGTLVSLQENPDMAWPDGALIEMLKDLISDPKNEVVIVSGRSKSTLEGWFSHLDLAMIAEHGVWLKERKNEWKIIEPLRCDWKDEIRPILEVYVDRTPGSFIEEKEFSLVWHYRKADHELSMVRAKELKDTLLDLTNNLNLDVHEGSKVVETKNTGINKGRAVLRWLERKSWDFVLAIGDDWTDEDTFATVPESAYSIKVGFKPSQARYNVDSVEEVRGLLGALRAISHDTPLESDSAI